MASVSTFVRRVVIPAADTAVAVVVLVVVVKGQDLNIHRVIDGALGALRNGVKRPASVRAESFRNYEADWRVVRSTGVDLFENFALFQIQVVGGSVTVGRGHGANPNSLACVPVRPLRTGHKSQRSDGAKEKNKQCSQ